MKDTSKIKHIFVLMLENRSFDHMLGYSGIPGINGLSGKSFANDDAAGQAVPTSKDAVYSGDYQSDPGHDFDEVMMQLWRAGQRTEIPPMTGFVRSYAAKCGGDVQRSHRIMKCFDPGRLPVLTVLARQYAVCDNWFSSLPGPTLPNRLFVHCGTSGGRLDMSPEYFSGFRTIYEVLDRASVPAYPQGIPSTIYSPGWTSAATFWYLMRYQDQFFGTLQDFYDDCQQDERNVPAYCFIEPRYSSGLDGETFLPESDQHPDSDVWQGEKLIYNVYQAIRKNKPLWESSIFVITYDEHGGFYDHVPPPSCVSPDGKTSEDPQFDFTRLGVRVPAVIVSPYINPGTVSHIEFDHTSIIATVRSLLTGVHKDNVLGNRAAAANTFDDPTILNRDEPRQDKPYIPVTPQPLASKKPVLPNDLQREQVKHATYLNNRLPAKERVQTDPSGIKTDQEADAYCSEVMMKVRHLSGRGEL